MQGVILCLRSSGDIGSNPDGYVVRKLPRTGAIGWSWCVHRQFCSVSRKLCIGVIRSRKKRTIA